MSGESCDVQPWRENHVWDVARDATRERDGQACVRCGSADRLEVNHKTPRWGDTAPVSCIHHLDGLETLCRDCHKVATREQWRDRRRAAEAKPYQPRRLMAGPEIAKYLNISRQRVHQMMDDLPEHLGIVAANTARPTVIWAAQDIIAWAKATGWIDPDDPREGVALDDEEWDVWCHLKDSA